MINPKFSWGQYIIRKYRYLFHSSNGCILDEQWLVSFDDNDGIGGQGYLLIDAFNGEAGDIKVDE